MSQENVEIVRRAYEEVSASHDMPPALFAPDFEVDSTGVGPANIGVVRGLDLAHDRLREYWETFDGFRVEVEEVIHADAKRVVTAVRDGGHLRGSDKEVSNHLFHVWTLASGRIIHLSIHTARSGALAAAGLSE